MAKSCWLVMALLACLPSVPRARAAAQSPVPSARAAAQSPAWENLKSLAGEWEGRMGGQAVRLSYRLISNGSALVETEKGPEAEMITVYHRDGDALMATHYCAAGNQPRMRATAADPNRIAFRFADVTNLSSPDAGHMRNLTITMPDADHLVQEWTFRDKGADKVEVFKYTRVK